MGGVVLVFVRYHLIVLLYDFFCRVSTVTSHHVTSVSCHMILVPECLVE